MSELCVHLKPFDSVWIVFLGWQGELPVSWFQVGPGWLWHIEDVDQAWCSLQAAGDSRLWSVSVHSILQFDQIKYFLIPECMRGWHLVLRCEQWHGDWERDIFLIDLFVLLEINNRGLNANSRVALMKLVSLLTPSLCRRWCWSWGVGWSHFLAARISGDTSCLRFSRKGWKTENTAQLWASSCGGGRSCCCTGGKRRSREPGTPWAELLLKSVTMRPCAVEWPLWFHSKWKMTLHVSNSCARDIYSRVTTWISCAPVRHPGLQVPPASSLDLKDHTSSLTLFTASNTRNATTCNKHG